MACATMDYEFATKEDSFTMASVVFLRRLTQRRLCCVRKSDDIEKKRKVSIEGEEECHEDG